MKWVGTEMKVVGKFLIERVGKRQNHRIYTRIIRYCDMISYGASRETY